MFCEEAQRHRQQSTRQGHEATTEKEVSQGQLLRAVEHMDSHGCIEHMHIHMECQWNAIALSIHV